MKMDWVLSEKDSQFKFTCFGIAMGNFKQMIWIMKEIMLDDNYYYHVITLW